MELTFRAFSKESGKMMLWGDIKKFGNLTKLISLNHVIVMQALSLKDSDGKTIYVDDVVAFVYAPSTVNTKVIAKVSFNNFGIPILEDVDTKECYHIENVSSSRLLGNVYQKY